MGKYYDGTKLLSMLDLNGKKQEIYMCTTNRSGGKTTYFGRLCVNRFLDKGEKFGLIYRYNYELDDVADKFFKDLKVKSGYKAVEKFLESGKKFDGVVCSSDEIAIGVINALREKGIRVPEDVSVIGFNDNAVSSYFYPKITTVRQPSYDMGSVAMRMLIKMLNNKPIEQDQYVLDYKIINRESTK